MYLLNFLNISGNTTTYKALVYRASNTPFQRKREMTTASARQVKDSLYTSCDKGKQKVTV